MDWENFESEMMFWSRLSLRRGGSRTAPVLNVGNIVSQGNLSLDDIRQFPLRLLGRSHLNKAHEWM